MLKNNKTIKELLAKNTLPLPELEIILAFLLKKSREFILLNPNLKITTNLEKKFNNLVKKRLTGWPMAYLIKEKYFYGYKFIIEEGVLIPRPETESLLDLIREDLQKIDICEKDKKINFLDIGTGSGAIIISLAKTMAKKNKTLYKKSCFYALDVSSRAISIANKNIKKHNLIKKIKISKSNLLKNIPQKFWQQEKIILVANLPYLTKKQIAQEPSIAKEPKIALNGGYRGANLYQQLIFSLTNKKFFDLTLYCEIDPAQAMLLKKFAQKTLKNLDIKIHLKKDLRKKNRFLIIEIRKQS